MVSAFELQRSVNKCKEIPHTAVADG